MTAEHGAAGTDLDAATTDAAAQYAAGDVPDGVALRVMVPHYLALKVRLFGGTFGRGGRGAWAVRLGLLASIAAGVASAAGVVTLHMSGSQIAQRQIYAVGATLVWLFAALLAAVGGLDASIDPRKLIVQPIRLRALAAADLVSGLVSLTTPALGLAVVAAVVTNLADNPLAPVVAATFLLLILLTHRVTALGLGYLTTTRARPLASTLNVVAGLAFITIGQAPQVLLDPAARRGVYRAIDSAPSARLGAALDGTDSGTAVLTGVALCTLLGVAYSWLWPRFASATSTQQRSRRSRGVPGRIDHAVGSVRWRTVAHKRRDARDLVNASMGLGIGFGVIVVPVLVGLAVGGNNRFAILGASSLQTAILMADSNRFGVEGPALIGDLLVADARPIVAGERRAVMVVPAVVVVVAPAVVAVVVGDPELIPAGWILGAGATVGASGIAMLVSTVGAYGVPPGDSPFSLAGGSTGCLGAILFSVSSLAVLVVSLPVAFAGLLTESTLVLTLVAVGNAGVHVLMGRMAAAAAIRRIRTSMFELWGAVQRS